jgi:uncharacterized protein (DUF433 family)
MGGSIIPISDKKISKAFSPENGLEGCMEIAPRISVDERVRFGRPVVTGTRIPVDLVLGKLAGGLSYDELIREYDLSMEDILACLDYAAKTISGEEIRAVG